MKVQLLTIALAIVLGASSKVCLAQDNNAQIPPIPSIDERQTYREYLQVQGKVYTTFQQLQKQPDKVLHAYEGPYAATIQLMGWLHMSSMAPTFLEMLDFELDSATVSHGTRLIGYQFYPAAVAYSKIASKDDMAALLGTMQKPQSEKMLTICAWILGEVHGKKLAILKVKNELEEEKTRLDEDKYKERDGAYKTNLQRIEELLESQPLMIMTPVPEKKSQ